MANEDADYNARCMHSKEYLLCMRSAVCSSSVGLGIRAEPIKESKSVNISKLVAQPVAAAPITACLEGLEPDVLHARRGELRSIEEETGTHIKEKMEKHGAQTCSVVVAGATTNVEKAVLLVSQVLLGDTSNSPAVDNALDDEPKPPLPAEEVLVETDDADTPEEPVGEAVANPLVKSITPADRPGRWRHKRLAVEEPDLELSPSDKENESAPNEFPLAKDESACILQVDKLAQTTTSTPLDTLADLEISRGAKVPAGEADTQKSYEQPPDDAELGVPLISEKSASMAFGPSPLLLMAFAKANESSQEAVRTADEKTGATSPKAALISKKKKSGAERRRAQQEKKAKEPVRFTFPKPSPIEGVKSRKKVILKMDKLSFTYGAKDKTVVSCAALTLSQVTRMVVTGAKGAGKSTVAKLITGEQKPTEGTISKAAGLRMACISQEALDDVLDHALDTPVEYVMRRFNEAGPGLVKSRESLENCGVDEDTANHKKINQLNGSMKAQIALAAAMCESPHILILDEPSKHFENEGLNALSAAMKDYAGGVVIFAHNKDKDLFNDIATEKWTLRGGQLCMDSAATEGTNGGVKGPDTAQIKLQYKDGKAIRDRMCEIQQMLTEAKKSNTLSNEDMWKLFDELTKLKEFLKS
mmetsp:Transcript_32336/g.57246  ORF Transcript_32336/g.57246 Transcript_32336/m.57246 type:complete len:645 (+) Transcript_32336:138-2072(+)